MISAQNLIDEISVQILADKDWDNFRWIELRNKVEEDKKVEQSAIEDAIEKEDIINYEKEELKNKNGTLD